MDLPSLLRQVALFSELGDGELLELSQIGRRLTVGAGEVVFDEGSPGGTMYVVLSGEITLARRTDADELILATVGPGEHFGEIAMIDGGGRSAGATAAADSELLELGEEPFMALVARSPRFGSAVLAGLAGHVRSEHERYNMAVARVALEQAQSEVERHRLISQMVAGVAHEINTPLGIATQAATMVAEQVNDEALQAIGADGEAAVLLRDVAEAVALIERNVARAAALIHAFKNLSAREATGVIERLQPRELIDEVIQLFSVQGRSSRLKIDVRDGREQAGTWTGLVGPLTQVLLNLLTNIDRYAYPHGEDGAVLIELGDATHDGMPGLTIEVRDFGAGIPSEHLDQVFDPFFTTGRGSGGTGLGLSIVHNLITGLLGGTVVIESEPGAGTSVRLWLPHAPGTA